MKKIKSLLIIFLVALLPAFCFGADSDYYVTSDNSPPGTIGGIVHCYSLQSVLPLPGGGTPGGSNTQVQFNDGGAFGGNLNFTFDKTTGTVHSYELEIKGKMRVNTYQMIYLPDQTNFAGSLIFGNGGGSLSHIGGVDGQYNLFVGINSGIYNTTGNSNVFFGSIAGYSNTTGQGNSFMGTSAGQNNTTGYYNSFMGASAGQANIAGYENTFVGTSSGASNISGSDNAFLGQYSGGQNTTGQDNTFLGQESGGSNTTGSSNIYIGRGAAGSPFIGYGNSTGSGNVFIGYFAGSHQTGSNVFLIDDRARPSASDEYTKSLIYGVFADDPVSQILTLNAKVGIGTVNPSSQLDISGSSSVGAELRLREATVNGTTYIGLKAPNSISQSIIWEIPGGAGTLGYVPAITQVPSSGNGWVGILNWASGSGGGMSDPMTTIGDMIYRNISNTTDRLPIQTLGQIMTVVTSGGHLIPGWATPASGLTVGGSDKDVQVNASGTFGADSGIFTYDYTNHLLSVLGSYTGGKISLATRNISAGTGSYNQISLGNDSTADQFYLRINSSAFTTYGGYSYLWSKANAPMIFGVNNAEKMRLETTGQLDLVSLYGGGPYAISLYPAVYGGAPYAALTGFIDSASGPYLNFAKGRATTPYFPQSGDALGTISFAGFGGGALFNTSARIIVQAAGLFSVTSTPSDIIFQTVPVGSLNTYERMRITNDGYVNIAGLTASKPVFTDANKNLISGTGSGGGSPGGSNPQFQFNDGGIFGGASTVLYIKSGLTVADIQTAVNSLPSSGGIILVAGGTFTGTTTFYPQGSDATVRTGVKIIAAGPDQTIIQKTSGGGTVVEYTHSGSGYILDGVQVDGNNNATKLLSIIGATMSQFKNFRLLNVAVGGTAFDLNCENVSGGWSSTNLIENFFIQIGDAYGMVIDGTKSGNINDWHRNVFHAGVIQVLDSGTPTSYYPAVLDFTDSNTFIEVDIGNTHASTKRGLLLRNTFSVYPQSNNFYGCSIRDIASSGTPDPNYFHAHSWRDGENLPYGITGAWGWMDINAGGHVSLLNANLQIRKEIPSLRLTRQDGTKYWDILDNETASVDYGLSFQRTGVEYMRLDSNADANNPINIVVGGVLKKVVVDGSGFLKAQ
jgi:hypothetical protein